MKKTILMHGPEIGGEKIVERQVPEHDAQVYRNLGYEDGPIPVAEDEKRADGTPAVTYTEEEAKAHIASADEPKDAKPVKAKTKARKKAK